MLSQPDAFSYKQPPYEYEFERLPMDLIIGSRAVRTAVEQGASVMELEQGWQEELTEFNNQRHNYFLYA